MFDHETNCPKCGVVFITCAVEPRTLCTYCTTTQYGEKLQGEAVRLFEPAPTQLPRSTRLLASPRTTSNARHRAGIRLVMFPAIPTAFEPRDAILERHNLPPIPVTVVGLSIYRSYDLERGEHYRRAMAVTSWGTVVGLRRIRF